MRFEHPRIYFTARSLHANSSLKFRRSPLRTARAQSRLHAHVPTIRRPQALTSTPEAVEPRPTGYDFYDRSFTAEGGIKHEYRDVERTLPVILGKLCLGTIALVATYYAGAAWSPMQSWWWNLFAYFFLAGVYAFILIRDMYVQRTIEIRPDCMIIEGLDTFWKGNMPLGWPEFRPDENGHLVFAGVYGTRWIEYLTIRRLDEFDRAPEVFAEQVTAAMKSQWELPSKGV